MRPQMALASDWPRCVNTRTWRYFYLSNACKAIGNTTSSAIGNLDRLAFSHGGTVCWFVNRRDILISRFNVKWLTELSILSGRSIKASWKHSLARLLGRKFSLAEADNLVFLCVGWCISLIKSTHKNTCISMEQTCVFTVDQTRCFKLRDMHHCHSPEPLQSSLSALQSVNTLGLVWSGLNVQGLICITIFITIFLYVINNIKSSFV